MLCRLYAILVILAIPFAGCNKPKTASETTQTDSATLTSQRMSVHTILTRTRDSSMSPRDTTHIFAPTDTIHGVIHSDHAREGTVLIGKWFFESGQKVAENSTRLSPGPNISYFDLMNETPWPSGKYKLLIVVDSTVVDSAEFAVANKK